MFLELWDILHGAAHGRLGVQEMVDRLATRVLVKEHCVWVHVQICNVLCVICVCMCVASPFFPRHRPFIFFVFAARSSEWDPDNGRHRSVVGILGYGPLTWHQTWM